MQEALCQVALSCLLARSKDGLQVYGAGLAVDWAGLKTSLAVPPLLVRAASRTTAAASRGLGYQDTAQFSDPGTTCASACWSLLSRAPLRRFSTWCSGRWYWRGTRWPAARTPPRARCGLLRLLPRSCWAGAV